MAKQFCPVGTEVQTLIFNKEWWTARQAQKWARTHDFKAAKVDETSASWRLRQKPVSRFRRGSFRTITFRGVKGIKAVVACPKLNKSKKRLTANDILKGLF